MAKVLSFVETRVPVGNLSYITVLSADQMADNILGIPQISRNTTEAWPVPRKPAASDLPVTLTFLIT